MPNFANGKIYQITSPDSDKKYIGSTCKTLKQRLSNHVTKFKLYTNDNTKGRYTSYDILEMNDYEISLLEKYPCKTKEELYAREQYYIDLNKDNVTNERNSHGVNMERQNLLNKEWKKNNQDKVDMYNQTFRESEIGKAYMKGYLAGYRARPGYKELNKKYYESEKGKEYNANRKLKMCTCECGSTVNIRSVNTHKLSQKHLKFVA